MSHFGILSFPGTGHLHPLTALGRELVRRGHQVTVFQVADVEPLIRSLSKISPLSNDGNAILISSLLQPLALRAL